MQLFRTEILFLGLAATISYDHALTIQYTMECKNRCFIPDSLDLDWRYTYDDNGIVEENVQVFAQNGTDVLKMLGEKFQLVDTKVGRPFSIDPPDGYHDPIELLTIFSMLEEEYPEIAQLVDVTEYLQVAPSIEGRNIYALKLSDNVKEDEVEPNVLLVSNHHARELITPELALHLARELLAGYGTDSKITHILSEHQIYIMWTMNPDGLNYVWNVDNMWRKNRRLNSGGSYGVDQNRNYPVGWDYSCGGSTTQTSGSYRGSSAASEPETQLMVAFQQDRNFAKVMDFHSYAREVRINYGTCASLPKQIDEMGQEIAQMIALQMEVYKQARSCCMGGNIHNAYARHGALSFLVETGKSFQPDAIEMTYELELVWPGVLLFLSEEIPVEGTVSDLQNDKPLLANFKIEALTFEVGESFNSNPKNGLFHLWLPVGVWNVSISAEGYQSKIVEVEVESGRRLVENIKLSSW